MFLFIDNCRVHPNEGKCFLVFDIFLFPGQSVFLGEVFIWCEEVFSHTPLANLMQMSWQNGWAWMGNAGLGPLGHSAGSIDSVVRAAHQSKDTDSKLEAEGVRVCVGVCVSSCVGVWALVPVQTHTYYGRESHLGRSASAFECLTSFTEYLPRLS